MWNIIQCHSCRNNTVLYHCLQVQLFHVLTFNYCTVQYSRMLEVRILNSTAIVIHNFATIISHDRQNQSDSILCVLQYFLIVLYCTAPIKYISMILDAKEEVQYSEYVQSLYFKKYSTTIKTWKKVLFEKLQLPKAKLTWFNEFSLERLSTVLNWQVLER